MNKHKLIIILAVIATIGSIRAEEPKTLAQAKLSPVTPGKFANLHSCEMTFGLGWKDIANAGQLVFTINNNNQIKSQAQFGSIGAARKLYAFDGELISVIDGKTLRPIGYQATDKYPNETDEYSIEFTKDNFTIATNTKVKESGEVIDKKRNWKIKNAFDLLSASFYMRSQPLEKEGESYTFVVVPNDTPYLVTATYVGKIKRSNGTEDVDALKLDLNIQKIQPAGKNMVLSPIGDTIKSTSIYFSADADRVPLGLSAALSVGSVEVGVTKMKKL